MESGNTLSPTVSAAFMLLKYAVRQGRGLISFAEESSKKLGLKPLSVLETRPPSCQAIIFHQDEKLKIQWNKVDEQLNRIGALTGIAACPKELLLVLIGSEGSTALRLIDIQQRRHEGILQYYKEI
jgi:hypothetical protein